MPVPTVEEQDRPFPILTGVVLFPPVVALLIALRMPDAWPGLPSAGASLSYLCGPLLAVGIVSVLAWGVALAAYGAQRCESTLRHATGWRPPATVHAAFAQGVAVLALATLVRLWTFQHYIGLPLHLVNSGRHSR